MSFTTFPLQDINTASGLLKSYLSIDDAVRAANPLYSNLTLLSADDGTFEGGIGNWTEHGNHDLSRQTSGTRTGAGCLLIWINVEDGQGNWATNYGELVLPALTLGVQYTIRFYAYQESSIGDVWISAATASTSGSPTTTLMTAYPTYCECVHVFTATSADVADPKLRLWVTADPTKCDHGTAVIDDLTISTVGSTIDAAIPERCPFLAVGEFTERVDANPGVVDVDNVNLDIAEDYSVFPEGFWYKIINGYPCDVRIMFTLVEGTTETFLFMGSLQRESIKWDEYYIKPTDTTPEDWVRGVSITLVSYLLDLKSVTMTDLITEILTHTSSFQDFSGFTCVQINAILSSIIKLAYGQAYNLNDVLISDGTDLLFNDDYYGTTPAYGHVWTSLWIVTHVVPSGGTTGWEYYVLFDSAYSTAWINRFANANDLMQSLCNTFGVVPRHLFGTTTETIDPTPANNKHRLKFLYRGRGTSGYVTMDGNVTESQFVTDTPFKTNLIRVAEAFPMHKEGDSTTANAPAEQSFMLNDLVQSGTPPPFSEFDTDINIDFRTEYGYMPQFWAFGLFTTHDNIHGRAKSVHYWDYSASTPGYVRVTSSSYINTFITALCQYLKARFSPGRTGYARTYGSIKANDGSTSSQRWLRTLCRTQISDGLVTRNYYATEVKKNVFTNRATVTWVQE